MTRFTEYSSAVAADGGAVLDWRYELISPQGQIVASTAETLPDGAIRWRPSAQPLSISPDRVSPRTLTITLPADDPVLVPLNPQSLLHPDSAHRVRMWAGLVGSAGTTWWPQATMLVEEADAVAEGDLVTVTVDLVDSLRPVRSDTTVAVTWERGEPVEDVVARIVGDVLETCNVTPTGWTTPEGGISAGADRYDVVNNLLEGVGHEMTADPMGLVCTAAIPGSDFVVDVESWRYGTGGIPIARMVRPVRSRVPQGWLIEGGSLRTSSRGVSMIIWDTDPRSEGYYDGPGESTIEQSRLLYVETVGQAAVAGHGQLRRFGTGGGIIRFESIPNPAIEQGDLTWVEYEPLGISGWYRIMAIELPLEVNGPMTVTARGVFDPAINFSAPVDDTEGCLVAPFDLFDRANENLENTEAQAGSADWTESGWSWAVQNEKAVQRYQGWSLAFANTPMCSTNQRVTVKLDRIPTGHPVGPACRASSPGGGQHPTFSCYAALADSTGRVELQVWQAGRSIATLGSYDTDSDLQGRDLTIEAVGSAISVQVSSGEIISATDTRLGGAHVGMLAFGSWTADRPAIDEFAAAPA